MNVKKCFVYVLALFGISVSFAFAFPVGSYADYEEGETLEEEQEEQEEQEEYIPLLTLESPNSDNEELVNSINALVEKIDSLIYSVDNSVLVPLSYTVVSKTDFESQFSVLGGYQDFYDDFLSYYDNYYVYAIDGQFLAGSSFTLASFGNVEVGYCMVSPTSFSIIYWDYIFEGSYEFSFDEDTFLFIVSPSEISPSSVETETISSLYVVSKVDENLLNDVSDMSNKLDSLQIDIYLLKNAVEVIGFMLLFSILYPLLTSVTHKFMGRKD